MSTDCVFSNVGFSKIRGSEAGAFLHTIFVSISSSSSHNELIRNCFEADGFGCKEQPT